MEQIKKFFPFMPTKDDVTTLVKAILFYMFVPGIIGGVLGFILGLTVILIPLAFIVGAVLGMYGLAGIVLAILSFAGIELK